MNSEPKSFETDANAVARFVAAYAANIAAVDDAAVTAQFADLFLAGGPGGVTPIRAVDFARALARRRQLFAALGCRSSTLIGVEQQSLTTRFWLVTTRWQMIFKEGAAGPAEEIPSDVVFILDAGTKPFRIVMFLHSEDVAARRSNGQVPQI